jgi:prophage regulatory protein
MSEIGSGVRLIGRREMAARLSICLATLHNYINRGVLPRPVKIGPNRVGWPESDLHAFIERAAAERDSQAA